ncbi:uncharacterized protein LOC131842318 [Achroia grisella]|uniref:uncharacterized protein LOC131842318 n=1 Tax=Achroia grisella TaxID=688607 RepID=UPI0027D2F860|nr:uncharacterized protein LOC131842318 [Achroia grisella]
MYYKIVISIFLFNLIIIKSTILKSEPDFLKPKLERNNIVNKGIWMKKNKENFFEKSSAGEFIFRANSLNVDDLLDNNFYAFGDNEAKDTPFVSNYVERSKRASDHLKKKHIGKGLKNCDGHSDCLIGSYANDKLLSKSKLIAKLRPASVFNDYPYEVAVLLGNTDSINHLRTVNESKPDNLTLNEAKNISVNIEPIVLKDVILSNNSNITLPKRSMKGDYESRIIKKIEYDEEINGTVEPVTYYRNVFNNDPRIWQKYTQKFENGRINERGMIKVLSMLTKTIKKINKQYNDIKIIRNKIQTTKEEIEKKILDLTKKLEDFNVKYVHLVEFNEKSKELEAKLENFKEKHKEISQNLIEFENEQKKFLAQQRQFYNIQKLMLAQNEKINIKQNLILRTQSEISHRQNNFARILKKAKQIYLDSKQVTKLNKADGSADKSKTVTHTPTTMPTVTESIKIDLFSIPVYTELVDQDALILKDKDEHPVDDLIYKYYFNNTFIDNLMRSKVLSNFVTNNRNVELTRNVKNKRNKEKELSKLNSTIMIPVNLSTQYNQMHREKRWIHHHSADKLKRHNRGKSEIITNNHSKDENPNNLIFHSATLTPTINIDVNNDPFRSMATKFCNEIGQNTNQQALRWCIEKSLRRLKSIDMKFPMQLSSEQKPKEFTTKKQALNNKDTVTKSPSNNEELESHLKQYEIKPDTEGNFYYDGSLHASDIVATHSEGFSDFMPGLDSNSHIEMDPLAFDLQSRRRASVRRINENILKKMAGKIKFG